MLIRPDYEKPCLITCIYVHVVEPKVQISPRIFSVIALGTICTRALRPSGKYGDTRPIYLVMGGGHVLISKFFS